MVTNIATQLFEAGEILRSEEPVLWAVIRGRGSVARIGLLLGWPAPRVERELKAYVAVNVLKVSSGSVYNLEQTSPRFEQLSRMKLLYLKIEEKLAGDDLVNIDPNDVASATKKVIAKARTAALREQKKDTLTEVQWKTLMSIWDHFKGAQFKTIDLARAQGRTTSGYTKGYIESLEKKGLVEWVSQDARQGIVWQLTTFGVDKASAADEVG